ncbi:MAG TPA: hypothetical protein VFE79_17485 [Paraburkholderia sp.]|jgi:hypothetical protein|nr:hypothetical protein [Paraburkholderia sp.]
MSGSSNRKSPEKHAPLQKRLYFAGFFALCAGLVAGVIIYAMAPPPDAAVSMYSITDPRYQMELQSIGGNAAVVAAQIHQWFDGLWHGRALAYTVAVLGIALAGACCFIGYFFAYDDSES